MTTINPKLSEQEKTDLLDLSRRRYMRASQNVQPWFEKAVRFYKIYREMQDSVMDPDEPNTFLPYAFGIIENITYKMSEPILKMMPPCRAVPKRMGQDQQARKFEQITRNIYARLEYQMGYIASCREQAITGSAWELDRWYQDYLPAKRWSKVKKIAKREDGTEVPYEAMEEQEFQYPQRIGYGIEFPSFFDVLADDPGIKRLRDQKWIIHDIRRVAIADLKKQMFTDPVTKEKRPVFDLTQLLEDYGEHQDGKIFPHR